VKEPTNLARLHSLASAYGGRPSDFFEIETELGAFQLDEACLRVGRHIENNVNNNKPAFEGLGTSGKVVQKEYRSVKHLAKKKVKIKEDGTW
jgi:hypothetical protein